MKQVEATAATTGATAKDIVIQVAAIAKAWNTKIRGAGYPGRKGPTWGSKGKGDKEIRNRDHYDRTSYDQTGKRKQGRGAKEKQKNKSSYTQRHAKREALAKLKEADAPTDAEDKAWSTEDPLANNAGIPPWARTPEIKDEAPEASGAASSQDTRRPAAIMFQLDEDAIHIMTPLQRTTAATQIWCRDFLPRYTKTTLPPTFSRNCATTSTRT